MIKYKKLLVIICLIMSCTTMSACFNYRDINKLLFVTALVIDVDDLGNPVVYAEAFRGVKGATPEGTDERILFNATGKTLFEAVRNVNATSSFKLNYTQNKVVIFTRKAAQFGLSDFVDFLDRDQEILVRPYVAVYTGDPEQLMKLELVQEKYIGFFIMELIENIGSDPRAVLLTLNDFYNQRVAGDKTSVMPIIDIPKDSLESKLEINGGAVIQNDKMISTLETNDGLGFNFLNDEVASGTLEVTNPCNINKFVTLEIRKSKTKTDISYDHNIVHLKKKIKVMVDFGEAQKSINLTQANVKKIQQQAGENILEACNTLFSKYKIMGVDIFNIKDKFYENYPSVKINDIIKKTKLEVNVEVEIKNTGTIRNFQ